MQTEFLEENECQSFCFLCRGQRREGHEMSYRHLKGAVKFSEMLVQQIGTNFYDLCRSLDCLDVRVGHDIANDTDTVEMNTPLRPPFPDEAIAQLFRGKKESERLLMQNCVRTLYREGHPGMVPVIVELVRASTLLTTVTPESEDQGDGEDR